MDRSYLQSNKSYFILSWCWASVLQADFTWWQLSTDFCECPPHSGKLGGLNWHLLRSIWENKVYFNSSFARLNPGNSVSLADF